MNRALCQVPPSKCSGQLIGRGTNPHSIFSALGFACVVSVVIGCDSFEPPGAKPLERSGQNVEGTATPGASNAALKDVVKGAPIVSPNASGAPENALVEPPPHPGPWLTILTPSAAVYSAPNVDRSNKLGYVQSGARIPVTGKPKPGDKCASGWVEVVGGGYVCSAAGTLDDKDGKAKFTIRRPDLSSVLPFTYARNVKNGTPLYRTVPTQSQMLTYEPYLKKETEKKSEAAPNVTENAAQSVSNGMAGAVTAALGNTDKAKSGADDTSANSAQTKPIEGATESPPTIQSDASVAAGDEASEEKPWWQQDGIEDKLHKIRLSDLKEESDGVLALRMVKGFYVAVDRTFRWNGRTWYKTTKGLVAPADRMGQAAPSDFHGVALGTEISLPVGWVYGGRETTQTYELDLEKKRAKPVGSIKRFVALPLTDETQEVGGVVYRAMKDGKYVRQAHLRITAPGELPSELRDGERWVDVNLSTQTLVVFEGRTPIYATLTSSGKSSKVKEKNHSTPLGQWRIREKHITTTMDGDGTAAGDQPYSIEDVPFVMYFHKSYAIHGAFWHRNYGVQMSHGCLNLAPLDAKAVFQNTEPRVPAEWHGAWSSDSKPGSLVVVHE